VHRFTNNRLFLFKPSEPAIHIYMGTYWTTWCWSQYKEKSRKWTTYIRAVSGSTAMTVTLPSENRKYMHG
jgi:hypothetical protein